MSSQKTIEATDGFLNWPNRRQYDKQLLALNALTDLAKKFSNKPDFYELADMVLLILAGQFSVTNAFARLARPGNASNRYLNFAIGNFRNEPLLEQLEISATHTAHFVENDQPQLVDRLAHIGATAGMAFLLSECGVHLVAPLVHDNRLIGIFGLGSKVNRKPFENGEIEIFSTIINTIAPLLVNAYLFQEITEVNDWYLQILDNVKQGVFVFGSDHTLKKVNLTGYQLLRDFRPHLKHIESLTRVPLEVLFPDSIYPGWSKQMIKAGTAREGRLWEKMKAIQDGRERIYRLRVSPVVHETQDIGDIIVTLDDVTDQEENEQRMFDLEKFAEKGMMASSISHELNNYLGMMLGGVELAMMALTKGNVERVESTLEKIKANVHKMERFTNGLMDYARLDNKRKMENLNTIVGDVLSFVTVQKKFKNINIITDLASDLPEYPIDTDQVAQLLLNLLNNAADAIREAERETGQINVQTAMDKDNVTLMISDNGIGMEPEVRERLFKSHITTKPNGHGYGLVTCNKIIQNHQGTVNIESQSGSGTTFTFVFPITGEAGE